MIHDRVRFVETFRGDDVFVSDAFVLERGGGAVAMKPDMMFSRNFAELLIKRHNVLLCLQVASCLLLPFQCFEQCFEVSFAETLRSLALDDLEKERRTIL